MSYMVVGGGGEGYIFESTTAHENLIYFFVHCLHQNKIELDILIFAAKNCILMDKFYTF